MILPSVMWRLRIVGASDEVDAIPFVVEALLHSEDARERGSAASALRKVVSHHELKRRCPPSTGLYLRRRTPSEVDLRPLAWVIEEWLAIEGDQSSSKSSAAVIVGYVGMKQFQGEIAALMDSRHPSMHNSVRHALELLEQVDDAGNILREDAAEFASGEALRAALQAAAAEPVKIPAD